MLKNMTKTELLDHIDDLNGALKEAKEELQKCRKYEELKANCDEAAVSIRIIVDSFKEQGLPEELAYSLVKDMFKGAIAGLF